MLLASDDTRSEYYVRSRLASSFRHIAVPAAFGLLLTVAVSSGAQGTAVMSQTYVNVPSQGVHTYKIATLAANNAAGYDHLHMLVTFSTWFAASDAYMDITLANRGGFTYQYTLRGETVSAAADLVAYCNGVTNDCNTYGTTDTVDLYLIAPAGYTTFVYTILEAQEEYVYSTPVDLGAAIPGGTLVFDAASALYPPTTYMNFAGNVGIGTTTPNVRLEVNGNAKVDGNLTLNGAVPTSASATCQFKALHGTALPWAGTMRNQSKCGAAERSMSRAM
jgi:hypothetical protein